MHFTGLCWFVKRQNSTGAAVTGKNRQVHAIQRVIPESLVSLVFRISGTSTQRRKYSWHADNKNLTSQSFMFKLWRQNNKKFKVKLIMPTFLQMSQNERQGLRGDLKSCRLKNTQFDNEFLSNISTSSESQLVTLMTNTTSKFHTVPIDD
jgi:hypothetical protein